MFFKKLTLYGFKSFVDKTELVFEPGIICIVGPNGCGKTNVSDSIRWSLGEQSAKSLRGTKMEDVIFNGTDSRKALGMAEVSLTMANVKDALSVEFEEVEVTRRVFRSGESEYLINKAQARLKDIDELFMDTGVGTNAYSILEQGKMDLVLSAKPVDRRYLFEEAAGISKYKARKEEAMRKLEATEQNLLRVSDILAEIKRQITSLERQAKRAEKYKSILEELKTAEVQTMQWEYSKRMKLLSEISEEENNCAKENDESFARLSGEEAKIEESKLKLLEKEKELHEANKKLYEIDKDLHKLENNVLLLQERKVNLKEYKEKTISEIGILNNRLNDTQLRIDEAKNALVELKVKIEETKKYIEEKEKESAEFNNALKQKESSISSARGVLMEILEKRSVIQNELNKVNVEHSNVKQNIEGLLCEKDQFIKNKEYIDFIRGYYRQILDLSSQLHQRLNILVNTVLEAKELVIMVSSITELSNKINEVCVTLERENSHWTTEPVHLTNKHNEMNVLLAELQTKNTELAAKFAEIENEYKVKQSQIEEEEKLYNSEYERFSRENTVMFEQKAQFASSIEKNSNYNEEIQKLNLYIEEIKMDIEKKKNEINSCDSRLESLETEEKDSASSMEGVFENRTKIEEEVKSREAEYGTAKEFVLKQERDIKGKRDNYRELNDKLNEIKLRKSQSEMEIKNIVEKAKKDYAIELQSMNIEVAAAPDEIDELVSKADELRKKLEEIGPVNMVAMEEYNELKERFEFLSTQEKDLRDAKESLLKTINTINQTTRSMFAEAFEKIRENFKNTFRKLFNGGMAELVLVDEGNLLETGIDIVARPPGKKLQSISLLSGGERALTAIALLFALFELKPSPFCVLDEIDAPLDEINVKRFTEMLKEFSKNTQFIIITHNKMTMEIADILYGITMEEPGVSKIISMRLKGKNQEPSKEEIAVA